MVNVSGYWVIEKLAARTGWILDDLGMTTQLDGRLNRALGSQAVAQSLIKSKLAHREQVCYLWLI